MTPAQRKLAALGPAAIMGELEAALRDPLAVARIALGLAIDACTKVGAEADAIRELAALAIVDIDWASGEVHGAIERTAVRLSGGAK